MPPRKKRPAPRTVGLEPTEVARGSPPRDVEALARQVEDDGGAVLARYRDPFGGAWLLLVSLPLERIEPTPYQREPSPTHVARLAGVIPKVGRFLDPVVAVRHAGGYWTPNGMHRLLALRELGARAITALLVPEAEIAHRILALNTEKAHNVKDRSLEVVRIARGLAADPATARRPESDWAFEFEEPAYLTLGLCYERNGRFSGGAYLPVVRRCDAFSPAAIAESLEARAEHAARLLELDAAVVEVVGKLKAAGLQSPYLKPFVVARINPLRFARAGRPGQKAPRADLEATLVRMLAAARKFDAAKVRPQDLAGLGGPPPEE
ncbi:MAG: ParB N-terminal domain-containing protein [Myxococcales bacterium]|nr:ParB N-terminal domain-containing protein [Myxococcales bacterium]